MTDIATIRARIDKAHDMVARLCRGKCEAGHRDPDLVIADGLRAGEEALAEVDRLRAALARAVEELGAVTSVAGPPLGEGWSAVSASSVYSLYGPNIGRVCLLCHEGADGDAPIAHADDCPVRVAAEMGGDR